MRSSRRNTFPRRANTSNSRKRPRPTSERVHTKVPVARLCQWVLHRSEVRDAPRRHPQVAGRRPIEISTQCQDGHPACRSARGESRKRGRRVRWYPSRRPCSVTVAMRFSDEEIDELLRRGRRFFPCLRPESLGAEDASVELAPPLIPRRGCGQSGRENGRIPTVRHRVASSHGGSLNYDRVNVAERRLRRSGAPPGGAAPCALTLAIRRPTVHLIGSRRLPLDR